jgi:hypothetical protein
MLKNVKENDLMVNDLLTTYHLFSRLSLRLDFRGGL